MPDKATIFRWIARHEDFRDKYAKAKLAQAEHMAEDLLDIADDGSNDWIERQDEDGRVAYTFNGEHYQRSRLRLDTRKWLLSKMLPKKYGERVTQEMVGANDGPIQLENVTDRDRAKALALLAKKAASE